MQTSYDIKTNFFDRILEIATHFGYKNITDFACNGLKYKSSEKLNRLKKEGAKPSVDILLDISNMFESVNLDWYITGKGEMLKNYSVPLNSILAEKEIENGKMPEESESEILKAKEEVIRSKDDLLKSKDELIAVLKYRLELAENYQPSKRNSA